VGLALHQEDGGHYWVLWLHDGSPFAAALLMTIELSPRPYLTSGYVHTSSRCASISEMQQVSFSQGRLTLHRRGSLSHQSIEL
jgi:hypothetical protein